MYFRKSPKRQPWTLERCKYEANCAIRWHRWPKKKNTWWVDSYGSLKQTIMFACKSGRNLKFRWRQLEIWNAFPCICRGKCYQALLVANPFTGEAIELKLRDFMDENADVQYFELVNAVYALDHTPYPPEFMALRNFQRHHHPVAGDINADYRQRFLVAQKERARKRAYDMAVGRPCTVVKRGRKYPPKEEEE